MTLFLLVCAGAWYMLEGVMQWYGSALLLYLGGKLFLSVLPVSDPPLPRRSPTGRAKVGAVITVYNEDPATLEACMASLAEQTMPPDWTVIVDDCSARPVDMYWKWDIPGEVIRQPTNLGKRHALAVGFRAMPWADRYMCVDSDAILEPDAAEKGLAEFERPGVVAVTGVATAANYKTNLLTRLVDLRYINAFLGERSAYSRLGSVLCVTGVLAFWSGSIIRDNLDEFLNQTFRGKIQNSGDDRHLTNVHQLYGKVVLARESVAATVVPEKVGHYLRQQSRWGRSFWRESIWAMTNLSPRQIAWWLSGVEMIATAAFTFGLVVAMVINPIMDGGFGLVDYLTWVCIGAWGRSVHAFAVRRGDRWLIDALIGFATAPLFGLLCLFVVMPVRVYALFTLSKTSWGTRSVVEVGEACAVESPLQRKPRHKAETKPMGISITDILHSSDTVPIPILAGAGK
jgi:hyaluronan synthase